jgi:phage tail protein X
MGDCFSTCAYKLYCKLLNGRLSQWIDYNNGLADEKKWFSHGKKFSRSNNTNIIDVRKKLRKSTFCAFIDFKKAYDTIDRNLLWGKLTSLGVDTKMCLAIKSLYNGFTCSVRLNSFNTDWFSVNCDFLFHPSYLIFS